MWGGGVGVACVYKCIHGVCVIGVVSISVFIVCLVLCLHISVFIVCTHSS